MSVYKLNLTAVFMCKIKNRTAPSSFLEKLEQPSQPSVLSVYEQNFTAQ